MNANKKRTTRAARRKLNNHDHGNDRHNRGLSWMQKRNRIEGKESSSGVYNWRRSPSPLPDDWEPPAPLTQTLGDVWPGETA